MGEAKPRVVSGSLRDRIARFENPSAAPLVPTHAFGTAGPTQPSSSVRSGLIGNRLPSLDPKTAGMVGGARKVSENRGLIGNRIPSGVGNAQKAASSGGRSASPAGSVDSSTASGALGSAHSPVTSRASSPPTSPGLGLPPSLLSATLPDNGGPGAMTPSSTRADAGEERLEMSVPSTPIQAPAAPTSGHYDLVAPNLKLAGDSLNPAQHALNRGLSTQSNAGSVAAPSMGSSRVSQYDPSSQGSENPANMMRDVSGISTPTSTPKADRRELEGSVRDEGSVVGEGELDDLGRRLEGLGVENVEVVNPGSVSKDHEGAPPTDSPSAHEGEIIKAGEVDGKVVIGEKTGGDEQEVATPSVEIKVDFKNRNPNKMPDPSQPSKEASRDVPPPSEKKVDDIAGHPLDEDPNQAFDLTALKAGDLETKKTAQGTHTADQNPINNIAEAGTAQGLDEQTVLPHEVKEQGGIAGQRMEDIEQPTTVEPPKEQAEAYDEDDLDVHTATEPSQSQSTATTKGQPKDQMPDIIEGTGAAGIRLDDAMDAGAGPVTSGETDALKDLLVERRTKEAEREGLNQGDENDLQTEEDRDEGVSRRAQLIKALDQNKDVDADMQEDTNAEQREKANAVTTDMTQDVREEEKAKGVEERRSDEEEHAAGEHKEKGPEEMHDEEQSKRNGGSEERGAEEETGVDGSKAETEYDEGPHEADASTEDVQVEEMASEASPGDRPVSAAKDEEPVVEAPVNEVPDSADSAETAITKDVKDNGDAETDYPSTLQLAAQPMQVEIEPAPIAQPTDESDIPQSTGAHSNKQIESIVNENAQDDSSTAPPSPAFPTPPRDDPDVVDPIPASLNDTRATTPLDPEFLKSFPNVPDEEKPRVQVHVSQSPVASPHKNLKVDAPETPLAKIPGKSKSLSISDLNDRADSESPEHARRDSLEVDATPTDKMAKANKRLSMKRSPKSPLLDDEDPGDFEPGEGWAVVTK